MTAPYAQEAAFMDGVNSSFFRYDTSTASSETSEIVPPTDESTESDECGVEHSSNKGMTTDTEAET